MKDTFEQYTKTFTPISLAGLNRRASLLNREENKYLLTYDEFIPVINDMVDKFDVLTIEDETVFRYKSSYFDSDDFIGYSYHHQGRNKLRFKVRTRHYVDSDLCFFEVKLKNKRGGTIKKRIPYAIENYGTITAEAEAFLQKTYTEVYGHAFTHSISSQIEIQYNRITLVAKDAAERMTIDFNLVFKDTTHSTPMKSFVIIETKSANGRGIADAIFKKNSIKSRSCSKYCLAANLLEYSVKYNRFKPLLKFYSSLPEYEFAEAPKTSVVKPMRRAPQIRRRAGFDRASMFRSRVQTSVFYLRPSDTTR